MVKTTRQNIPVDRWDLVSVIAIPCYGLTVNFDGLSNSSLESVIFPCNDQGGREVKGVSRVPELSMFPVNGDLRCSVFLDVSTGVQEG